MNVTTRVLPLGYLIALIVSFMVYAFDANIYCNCSFKSRISAARSQHQPKTPICDVCRLFAQPYPEDPAVYKPLSQEEIQRIKNEKKQKQNEKKQKVTENRKHLASVRVVQRNLVFVVGLSQRLADPEVSAAGRGDELTLNVTLAALDDIVFSLNNCA